MTLVLAVASADFIVVGADSRGTFEDGAGARVEINTHRKLIPVAKHVAILIYGDAPESVYLVKRFKYMNRGLDGVSRVAEAFAEFCRKQMEKIKDVPRHPNPKYFPNFAFIVSGLDTEGRSKIFNVPRSYTLSSINGFLLGRSDPQAIGGKWPIALYLIAQKFQIQQPEDMSKDELCKFVAQCIYDTMCIDGDVGGEIRIAVIDSTGMFERSSKIVRRGIEQWGQPV